MITRVLQFNPNLRPSLDRLLENPWFGNATSHDRVHHTTRVWRPVLFSRAKKTKTKTEIIGICTADLELELR